MSPWPGQFRVQLNAPENVLNKSVFKDAKRKGDEPRFVSLFFYFRLHKGDSLSRLKRKKYFEK
ncbi:MAG: hypothetical protein A3F15_02280 [Candidatus Wildermuthbacteria bacterium RIFCSPHIGHO2_12_FULL_40_12]|uniref:Uncharacterized protein n=1 Tax=Candidatus Wildermuthbacteria bacterium RIFCSPHIGHO2_12_FULL_40_12 TaxID=1802457 RepID=A0A1G2REJ8_9BACT|nr:MAG: hypothetical protein A3F15_02280 [Candidatus Wildermuthbacteria bacterium RIFCSPHIGHO2_12_FULL_40_12]